MAATSQPLATQVALDVLKRGGHAVDAAIAANAALGLFEPASCGLGGDLFALIWDGERQQLSGLNASGRTAAKLERKDLLAALGGVSSDQAIPLRGALSVTVPGAVDGWVEMHQRFGRLAFGDLFEPTIRYALDGFPVSDLTAHFWEKFAPALIDQPGFSAAWLKNGRTPRAGERVSNPDLTCCLEQIARGGRDAFYSGRIAEQIAAIVRQGGGHLAVEDLEAHFSTWDQPVSTRYRGCDIWQLPPNGQGIAVLQMLNLLAGYDLQGMGFGSVDHLHHLVEATKLVFEDRARWYADPAFFDVPVTALISERYAAQRRRNIDPRRAALHVAPGHPVLAQGDTVCIVTADRDRNMVSMMQSIFLPLGSGLTPKGLGFILQNRGALFALQEDHANVYAPGRRPFNTIIPCFVTRDGRPDLCFGVMGGDAQPQAETQVLLNLLDFGMSLQEAGDAPRILYEGYSQPTGAARSPTGGRVLLESGFPEETLKKLRQRGHDACREAAFYGGYQAIRYDPEQDIYQGASECRQDGQAAGY